MSNEDIGDNHKNYSFNLQKSNSNRDLDNYKDYQQPHQPNSNENMIKYDVNEPVKHNKTNELGYNQDSS